MRCRLLLCALFAGFCVTIAGLAAEGARIDRLIDQLSSNNFSEREEATKALDSVGAPALEPLKKAVKSNDAETRRRAEELVSRIEKRLESARILAPSKVTLAFQDMPLAEAVADFSKKCGQKVSLGGIQEKLAGRKVTLDVKDMSFWQALEQFCRSAGLIEASSVPMAMQVDPLQPGVRLPVRRRLIDAKTGPAAISQQIVLIDGLPQAMPTHYAGAARIRALPASTEGLLDPVKGTDEVGFTLGLGLEARVPLERVIGVRVDKAIDEHGQALDALLSANTPPPDPMGPVFIGNFKGMPQALLSPAGQHQVPVRFKAGPMRSKVLKDLAGTLTAQVRTLPEPVMTVNDILNAAGKSAKGTAGGSLLVRETLKQPDDQIKLRVELELPPDPNAGNWLGGGVIQIQGQGAVAFGGMASAASDMGLTLVDAKGQAWQLSSNQTSQVKINNNVVTHEMTLLFKPQPGQGEPAKLVYSASRPVIVEIPFQLKDVPLP